MKHSRAAGTAAYLGLLVLVCGVISARFFQVMLIRGDSMAPSYRHMQFVLVDKRGTEYRRGDVIAFRCEPVSEVLVKRIAAAPGDTVWIEDKTLFVNGEASPLYEPGAFDEAGVLSGKRILAEDEYFVIGDNLRESKDSRYEEIGTVRARDIIGRVM